MDFDPEEIKQDWENLILFIQNSFGKSPEGVESILFLIGVQELGQGRGEFTKEQKQDLMHIATCKVLSYFGFYQLDGLDPEGWPIWNLIKPVPSLNLKEQEVLIKSGIIEYFKNEVY